MGNRAVITASQSKEIHNSNDIGVYLHWNGGKDSVQAFLWYCKLKGFRPPEEDCYGWARLCQVIGNYFGGGLSIGIDRCSELDCYNGDNGVYIIRKWRIAGRAYFYGAEQEEGDLLDFLQDINQHQPKSEQLTFEQLQKGVEEFYTPPF